MQFVRPVGLLRTPELQGFTYGQIRHAVKKGMLPKINVGSGRFPFHIHDVNRWLKNFEQGR